MRDEGTTTAARKAPRLLQQLRDAINRLHYSPRTEETYVHWVDAGRCRLLAAMSGAKWLMASLLYGAGLRLRECLKLRVKDVDLGYRQIVVRDGKGAKDRVTMLPGFCGRAAQKPPARDEGAA